MKTTLKYIDKQVNYVIDDNDMNKHIKEKSN